MSKFLLLGFLLCGAIASGQTLPKFGEIQPADFQITQCDFEPEAGALVLFDNGEYYCNIIYNSTFPLQILNERHTRIKILNDKGLDAANVHIRYFSFKGEEKVTGISAQTYNLDASGNVVVTKLDKKLIYDKSLNKRFSETTFTLPDVKAGSIIEYRYTVSGSDDSRWYFQTAYPVKISKYAVNFPNELEMNMLPNCSLPYKRGSERRSGRDMQVISMENIPGLKNEPFISCREDYLQRVDARLVAINPIGSPRRSLVRSWQGLVRDLMEDEDFGLQLKKDIPRTAKLDTMIAALKDTNEIISTIHSYVRNNMEWNGQHSIWAFDGVKSAWKDKKGTSGEINLILVNLLKNAGIKAHPILVSTRKNGAVNTFYASLNQFNKVLAYVDLGDKFYILDASEKFTPSHMIPADVLASQGLVIEKPETYKWGWKTLWNNQQTYEHTVYWQGTVNNDGVLTGNATIESGNYAKLERLPVLESGKDKFREQFLQEDYPGFNIDSVRFNNSSSQYGTLMQEVDFRHELNHSGKYYFIRANIFSGHSKNPFIADNRFSDVFFGYNQRFTINANITLPENFKAETLPKNMRMIMPDTSISFMRILSLENNTISFRITVAYNRPFYTVDEYGEFKEFYKQLFEFLNEQIVITAPE